MNAARLAQWNLYRDARIFFVQAVKASPRISNSRSTARRDDRSEIHQALRRVLGGDALERAQVDDAFVRDEAVAVPNL